MRRGLVFLLVCAVAVVAVVAAVVLDLGRNQDRIATSDPVDLTLTDDAFAGQPRIVFRNTAIGPDYGLVASVALDDPTGPRTLSDLACERIDVAGDRGSCLQSERGVVTRYRWLDLDADLGVVGSTPLAGIPSRTRMSPDGRLTASTVFVSGHDYMQSGFSTATVVREVGGRDWGNLERFRLLIDGKEVRARDRNVWGVTFADDDTFYATVATGDRTHLVRGDLSTRTLTALREGAECPSLSPDGTRVAYKVDVGSAGPGETRWVVAVLDLAAGTERVLDRGGPGLDDQVQWLDDDTVLYGLPRPDEPGSTDVWQLDVDTDQAPSVLIEQAWSPSVVR